jgi:hypothetical protein
LILCKELIQMIKFRLIPALIFLLIWLATGVAAQKRAAPVRDFFPLAVGYSWTYRNDMGDAEYTVKVISEEKQAGGKIVYLLDKEVGVTIHSWYSKSAGLVLLHREAYQGQEGLDVTHEPASIILKNPLAAGTKWAWQGRSITGGDVSASYQVAGTEIVQVAAGRFRAVKINGKISDGASPLKTITYWYAEGVGLVKTVTESPQLRNSWELVSYSFKKTSSR